MVAFKGTALPLAQGGLTGACTRLGVMAAEVWAIVQTETDFPHCGFLPDKRPQILFERHIFSRLTGGRHDAGHPGISSPTPGGYGAGGAHQYDRLREAVALDESAALQSASWGMGQELGTGFKTFGFGSVQDMVSAMVKSEDAQLEVLVQFILANHIAGALQTHDWVNFARVYNGPNFEKNHYPERLKSNFAAFAAGPLPDLRIRTAQVELMFRRFDPGGVDGVFGGRTRSAMQAFQASAGLPVTDALDDPTFEALNRAT